MKVYFLIITLLLSTQTYAAEKEDDCGFNRIVEWTILTGRDFGTIKNHIEVFNEYLLRNAINYPSFKIKARANPKRSLLSLGEGGSSFLETIIKERLEKNQKIDNLHAADSAYLELKKAETDQFWVNSAGRTARAAKDHLTTFPNNYHATYFQNLDLRNPDGSQMQFDEVVSSYSLNFVLEDSSPEEQRRLLTKILAHMKKDGQLLMWPFDTFNLPDNRSNISLKEVLEQLKSEGKIQNYTIMGSYLGVQK